ncbi:MAG: hypothetical protein IH948_06160 [Bacteroidetes bacterium]|nr:hypothetical protein [Bacteroidota bacterium]
METKKPIKSLTIQSALVLLVVYLAQQYGFDFDEGNITEGIASLVNLVAVAGVIYGRIRAKTVIE